MFDSKYGSVLTILLIIVIVAIVAIIGYFGYEIIAEQSKKKAGEAAIEQFDTAHPTVAAADENAVDQNTTLSNATLNVVESNNNGNSSGSNKVMMEGYEVIGTIRIPSIELSEPILADVTKKSLETAVALLYTTNGLNQPGNSVIIGHNYRNNLFFSKNDQIEEGDTIYIKDKTGVELKYSVTQTFETASSNANFYKATDLDKTSVVLSTCTDDASTTDQRWIVIAERVD